MYGREVQKNLSKTLHGDEIQDFLRFPASITNFRNRGIIEIPSFRLPRHTDDQTMESQQLPETGVTREMFRLSSQYLTKPEKERRLLDSAGYRHQHW